jgi:hypothetical protein
MTSEDIKSELEREPFRPFRLHLVSGKVVAVKTPNDAHMLQNAVMVFFGRTVRSAMHDRYDVIALRNIERLELSPSNGKHEATKRKQKRPNHD